MQLIPRLAAFVFSCLVITIPQFAVASSYVTFNVPGARAAAVPNGINKWGTVTGYYLPLSGTGYYGFLYQSNGTITTFSVPRKWRTLPMSISNTGWIAGYYYGQDYVNHGFLRNPTYTTLDVPGAGTKSGQGTEALSINDAGQISGIYFDANSVEHGFIWDAGVFTSFDVPGGVSVLGAVLNQSGEIAGTYEAPGMNGGSNVPSGYIRDASGNFTTFTVPDSVQTVVTGINASGQIAGSYNSLDTYFRDQFGNITTFTVAGYEGTAGIEDSGNVVGAYEDAKGLHGWKRTAATGAVTYFSDPEAYGGEGTLPTCVSGNGKVAGYYFDSSGNSHDFVMLN
jgi:hypothetical protein